MTHTGTKEVVVGMVVLSLWLWTPIWIVERLFKKWQFSAGFPVSQNGEMDACGAMMAPVTILFVQSVV